MGTCCVGQHLLATPGNRSRVTFPHSKPPQQAPAKRTDYFPPYILVTAIFVACCPKWFWRGVNVTDGSCTSPSSTCLQGPASVSSVTRFEIQSSGTKVGRLTVVSHSSSHPNMYNLISITLQLVEKFPRERCFVLVFVRKC